MIKLNKKDLDNRNVNISLDDNSYDAVFTLKDNDLLLIVNFHEDIVKCQKYTHNVDYFTGIMLNGDSHITLINCIYHSQSSETSISGKPDYKIIYIIDRILMGYKLDGWNDKVVNNISASFADIRFLIDQKPYEYDIEKASALFNPINKVFKVNDDEYLLYDLSKYTFGSYDFIYNTNYRIMVKYKSSRTIAEAIYDIYSVRNLLILLLKRFINVSFLEMDIADDNNVYIIDCAEEQTSIDLDEFVDGLNHRNCIKIDKIDFDKVLEKFILNNEKLLPLEEVYFGVLKNKTHEITRFVNAITMLEYYSRTFDYDNSWCITKNKLVAANKTKSNKYKSKEPCFEDQVKSLIKNVNDVFKFQPEEVDTISRNIKDARTAFVHYESNARSFYDYNLFEYEFFIEDLILLNIYKILGIKINAIPNISYMNFIYLLNDLI